VTDHISESLAMLLYEVSDRFMGPGPRGVRWDQLAGGGKVRTAFRKMATIVATRSALEAERSSTREAELRAAAVAEYVRGAKAGPDELSILVGELASEAVQSRREVAAAHSVVLLRGRKPLVGSLLWAWTWRSLGPVRTLRLWLLARAAVRRAASQT